MKKSTYYFSHDGNASFDPKCVALIESVGWEGYGMYWFLIELLRTQSTYRYPIALLPALARRNNMEAEKVKSVVMDFDLFDVDGNNHFFSASLLKRMKTMENVRSVRVEAGRKSAEKRAISASSANAEQMLSNCSTSVEQVKESKRKEKKEKERKVKEMKEDILGALSTSLRDAVEGFMEHRISIKAPMSDRAVRLLLAELDKLTNDDEIKIAILNQSVINGWKGVFGLQNAGVLVDTRGRKLSESERIMML